MPLCEHYLVSHILPICAIFIFQTCPNQNIIEFKLASNSKLAHVFTQVKIYEAANCADGSLIVIFFFSEEEQAYSEQVIKDAGYEDMIMKLYF